jgi:hypothetical protein
LKLVVVCVVSGVPAPETATLPSSTARKATRKKMAISSCLRFYQARESTTLAGKKLRMDNGG